MTQSNEDKTADLAQRRKEEILNAAKHVFARNGFRCTKMEDIATHLGVAKGTVYRYFKDKKSLFLTVFRQGLMELSRAFETNVHPIEHPANKVRAAVKTYFEFYENDREHIEILMQARSEFKDEFQRAHVEMYRGYIVRIQENLRKGQATALFRKMDIEKTAEVISATLHGVLQGFYVREFGPKGEVAANGGKDAQYSELLTDRTAAVTSLLLEGLLKRDDVEDV